MHLGGEFTLCEFRKLFDQQGIKRFLTSAYTPQHNVIIERKNGNIINLVRRMLKKKCLPLELWGEVVST